MRMLVGFLVVPFMLMMMRPMLPFGIVIVVPGIVSVSIGMAVLMIVNMGVLVIMGVGVDFFPVSVRMRMFMAVFVLVAMGVRVFSFHDSPFEEDFMVNQIHPFDSASDGDLVPEDADESETVVAVGLDDVHGFHDQPLFPVFDDISIGFTHG